MSETVGYILLIRRAEGPWAGRWDNHSFVETEDKVRLLLGEWTLRRPGDEFAVGRVVIDGQDAIPDSAYSVWVETT